MDIFDKLNGSNLSLEVKACAIIDYGDIVNAFPVKLELWCGKVAQGKFTTFETLKDDPYAINQCDQTATNDKLNSVILKQLSALHQEMSLYFTDVISTDLAMMRNPFTASIQSVHKDFQEEFIDLMNDNTAKDLFQKVSLFQFSGRMVRSYPKAAYLVSSSIPPI